MSGGEWRRRIEGTEQSIGVIGAVAHITSFRGVVAGHISSVGVGCFALERHCVSIDHN